MIQQTRTLLAYPETLRKMAANLRASGIPYQLVRVRFTHHNRAWKGTRGLGLQVSHDDYCLYTNGGEAA